MRRFRIVAAFRISSVLQGPASCVHSQRRVDGQSETWRKSSDGGRMWTDHWCVEFSDMDTENP